MVHEIGGGSVRIHQDDIQEKMFRDHRTLRKETAQERFGFLSGLHSSMVYHLTQDLHYGLDRMVMLMTQADSPSVK